MGCFYRTVAGTLGLSLTLTSPSTYKIILVIVGAIFMIVLLYGYANKFDAINKLLSKLKEGE